jgi:hypothetical protein
METKTFLQADIETKISLSRKVNSSPFEEEKDNSLSDVKIKEQPGCCVYFLCWRWIGGKRGKFGSRDILHSPVSQCSL